MAEQIAEGQYAGDQEMYDPAAFGEDATTGELPHTQSEFGDTGKEKEKPQERKEKRRPWERTRPNRSSEREKRRARSRESRSDGEDPFDFLASLGRHPSVDSSGPKGRYAGLLDSYKKESKRPEAGKDGCWECSECRNVNYPRRPTCFRCKQPIGRRALESVKRYVKQVKRLMEHGNDSSGRSRSRSPRRGSRRSRERGGDRGSQRIRLDPHRDVLHTTAAPAAVNIVGYGGWGGEADLRQQAASAAVFQQQAFLMGATPLGIAYQTMALVPEGHQRTSGVAEGAFAGLGYTDKTAFGQGSYPGSSWPDREDSLQMSRTQLVPDQGFSQRVVNVSSGITRSGFGSTEESLGLSSWKPPISGRNLDVDMEDDLPKARANDVDMEDDLDASPRTSGRGSAGVFASGMGYGVQKPLSGSPYLSSAVGGAQDYNSVKGYGFTSSSQFGVPSNDLILNKPKATALSEIQGQLAQLQQQQAELQKKALIIQAQEDRSTSRSQNTGSFFEYR